MPLLQVLHKKKEKRILSSKKRRYLLHDVRNDHKSLLHLRSFPKNRVVMFRVFRRLLEWETSHYSAFPWGTDSLPIFDCF